MKRTKTLVFLSAFLTFFAGSKEDIDMSARYVFTARTIMDYLSDHEQYSEYCKLLGIVHISEISETTLDQLLDARGHYTVFAPTNEAIEAYLHELDSLETFMNAPTWDGFTDQHKKDSIQQSIVMSSIIDFGDNMQAMETIDFPLDNNAEIPIPNLYDRKLTVMHGLNEALWINGSELDDTNRNITCTNGYVQCMNQVVASNNNTLSDFIIDILSKKKEGFYVASLLAQAVGLTDTLKVREDEAYRRTYLGAASELQKGPYPTHRYYGFTYFAETDSLWSATLGKPALDITVQDVVDFVAQRGYYPDAKNDENYTSEDNILNQFVTYHLLPIRMARDRIVYHRNEKGFDPVRLRQPESAIRDFYTTMGKRRLIQFFEGKESGGVCINRFPKMDNGRRGTYHELYCEPGKEGIRVGESDTQKGGNLSNAIVFPINDFLAFDQETRRNLAKERIRWDICGMLPEMMNNDMRLSFNYHNEFPKDVVYKYFDDVWVGDETDFRQDNTGGSYYSLGYSGLYQGDAHTANGSVDMILRLPPVPTAGTYEFRYGVGSGDSNRGIFQIYWGDDRNRLVPQGVPIDIRMGGLYFHTPAGNLPNSMGWEDDTEDDDYNATIDKNLRSHDYMKGPQIIEDGRDWEATLRRIIVRQYMEPDKTYYLRIKSATDKRTLLLVLDYFELVSKEVYDNPVDPEDVW